MSWRVSAISTSVMRGLDPRVHRERIFFKRTEAMPFFNQQRPAMTVRCSSAFSPAGIAASFAYCDALLQ
jgi:hypothetical protein